MDKVCVLMTCYNPKQYIVEQVNSILNQKDVYVDLIIRDDCSTDKTWINALSNKSNITLIYGTENIGVANNILQLIRYAKEYKSDYKFFAYCDQDDVWLSDKLITGIKAINGMNIDKPCLYYSNLRLVNENLEGNDNLFPANIVKNTLGQSLSQIFAFACTFIFNYRMVEEILKQPIEYMGFDHLVYYIAILKGEMFFDEEPHILYRQHGSNVSGKKYKGIKRVVHKIRTLKDEGNDPARAGGGTFKDMSNYILKYFKNELSEDELNLIKTVAEYDKSFVNRIKLICSSQIKAGYQPKDFYRVIRILLGRY